MTAYSYLMCAALTSWAYPHPLTPVAFAEFVQSILTNLPSSSAGPSAASPAATFGSILIDIMWSIDLQLDEFASEAKAAVGATADETMQGGKDTAGLMAKAKKAQQNAEGDKQRLQLILKKLLVCFFKCCQYMHYSRKTGIWRCQPHSLPGTIGDVSHRRNGLNSRKIFL